MATSSSSQFCVYPNQTTTTLFHHPPISNLRFSHSSFSSDNSLRFHSGRMQLKPKAAASTNKLVMDETPPPSSTAPPTVTTVDVNLGDRSYPIYIGSGLLDQPDLLQRSQFTCIYTTTIYIYVYGSSLIYLLLLPTL